MAEGGRFPCRNGVTGDAVMRELSGNMVRTGDCVELILVTAETIRRKSFILTSGMARCTCRRRVRTHERECRRTVIEC